MEPVQASLDEGRAGQLVGPGEAASTSAFLQLWAASDLSASLPESRCPSQPTFLPGSSSGTSLPAATEPALSRPSHLEAGREGRLGDRGSTQQDKALDSDLVIVGQLALSWPSHSSGRLGSPWRWASQACPLNRLRAGTLGGASHSPALSQPPDHLLPNPPGLCNVPELPILTPQAIRLSPFVRYSYRFPWLQQLVLRFAPPHLLAVTLQDPPRPPPGRATTHWQTLLTAPSLALKMPDVGKPEIQVSVPGLLCDRRQVLPQFSWPLCINL